MATLQTNSQLFSSEQEALLGAIVQNPDEDTPRLMYADWLDEHGVTEQAEFIRLQCDPARPPDDAFHRLRVFGRSHAAREHELLQRHGGRWVAQARIKNARTGFDRGFVAEIALAPQRFERCVERAFAPLRSVWFTDEGAFGQFFTVEQLRAAVASPHLRRFTAVSVYKAPIGVEGWRALAESPHLERLERLDLGRSCTATRAAVRVLTESPGFAGVRALGLECWTMRVESSVQRRACLDALARAETLRGLKAIDLCTSRSRRVVDAVLASGWRLRQLYLADNDLGDGEAAALAGADHLAELSELDLSGNRLGDNGAAAVARSRAFAGLRALNLSRNRIGDRGALALAEGSGPESGCHLDLSRNPIWGVRAREALRVRFGCGVRLDPDEPTPTDGE